MDYLLLSVPQILTRQLLVTQKIKVPLLHYWGTSCWSYHSYGCSWVELLIASLSTFNIRRASPWGVGFRPTPSQFLLQVLCSKCEVSSQCHSASPSSSGRQTKGRGNSPKVEIFHSWHWNFCEIVHSFGRGFITSDGESQLRKNIDIYLYIATLGQWSCTL